MNNDKDMWVITAAHAVADEHGLLKLHLAVEKHPGALPPPQREQHVYAIAPEAAAGVLDAIMRVATEANPGSTEA